MIESCELRRNNIVSWKGRNLVVDCIYPNAISDFGSLQKSDSEYLRKTINCSEIEPIFLTEDILLKCGFNTEDDSHSTFLLKISTYSLSPIIKLYAYLGNTKYVSSIRLIQGYNSSGNMIQIKSLHEFQNLYFALMSKELEIKL